MFPDRAKLYSSHWSYAATLTFLKCNEKGTRCKPGVCHQCWGPLLVLFLPAWWPPSPLVSPASVYTASLSCPDSTSTVTGQLSFYFLQKIYNWLLIVDIKQELHLESSRRSIHTLPAYGSQSMVEPSIHLTDLSVQGVKPLACLL